MNRAPVGICSGVPLTPLRYLDRVVAAGHRGTPNPLRYLNRAAAAGHRGTGRARGRLYVGDDETDRCRGDTAGANRGRAEHRSGTAGGHRSDTVGGHRSGTAGGWRYDTARGGRSGTTGGHRSDTAGGHPRGVARLGVRKGRADTGRGYPRAVFARRACRACVTSARAGLGFSGRGRAEHASKM